MHTIRSGAAPDAAGASDAPAASVLLITGSADAPLLHRALESSGAFRVVVADGIEPARARLRGARFDAVLLDLEDGTGSDVERVAAVRGIAGRAMLVVRGGDPDRPPAAGGADEWLAPDDSPRAVAACLRGAVQRRRLEDELHWRTGELAQSEARFRNIVERTPDGIVIVGRDGRIRFANPGAERMLARSAADLLGEDFGIVVVSGETTEMDIVRPAAMEPLIAELRVSTTTWDGSAAHVISLRDITDRKRAEERAQRLLLEEAAREQAERAGARTRILADAGAVLDASLNADATLASLAALVVPRVADWCVIDLLEGDGIRRVAGVHADPAGQPLLAELTATFPPRAGAPRRAARVLPHDSPELPRDLGLEDDAEPARVDAHAALLARLGTRSVMTVPLEAREQSLGVMTFVRGAGDFDETDLELAVELASRAARALDNARLFEAALDANRVKSDFLAVMSHELRTPLTAILGYTDLLLEGVVGELDGTQGRYLTRIRAGATQLLRIIQEILTYALAEAGREQARPAAIRIGELVDEVAAFAGPLVRDKGLEFDVKVEQRDAMIHTDVGKVRQVVLNLLTNAAKFTERGAVRLTVGLLGDELSIAVSDTGIGIAHEALETIFEAFRQVEQGATRRAGGTGLGLSVSRQLATLLGGTLTVESTPGQGSTFTLRLPASVDA